MQFAVLQAHLDLPGPNELTHVVTDQEVQCLSQTNTEFLISDDTNAGVDANLLTYGGNQTGEQLKTPAGHLNIFNSLSLTWSLTLQTLLCLWNEYYFKKYNVSYLLTILRDY